MDDVVTESELAKARNDPTFRQQFLARNLGLLRSPSNARAVRTIKTPKRHVKSKKGRIFP